MHEACGLGLCRDPVVTGDRHGCAVQRVRAFAAQTVPGRHAASDHGAPRPHARAVSDAERDAPADSAAGAEREAFASPDEGAAHSAPDGIPLADPVTVA